MFLWQCAEWLQSGLEGYDKQRHRRREIERSGKDDVLEIKVPCVILFKLV